ncbi:hypothetical protein [Crenobacter cavernae]|nr:hypothetical protein [Crenobacter cavernae]
MRRSLSSFSRYFATPGPAVGRRTRRRPLAITSAHGHAITKNTSTL